MYAEIQKCRGTSADPAVAAGSKPAGGAGMARNAVHCGGMNTRLGGHIGGGHKSRGGAKSAAAAGKKNGGSGFETGEGRWNGRMKNEVLLNSIIVVADLHDGEAPARKVAAGAAAQRRSNRAWASRPRFRAPWMMFEAKVCSSEAHGAIIHSAAAAALSRSAPSSGGCSDAQSMSVVGSKAIGMQLTGRRIWVHQEKWRMDGSTSVQVAVRGYDRRRRRRTGGARGGITVLVSFTSPHYRITAMAPPGASRWPPPPLLRSVTSSGADAFLNG
ncbi:hypothetical protein B0H11DRAFT_2202937 [Mycena galericulata]|nr:hypothetical protein B0H11DRAFT_2202937 [Mycena galericulata]